MNYKQQHPFLDRSKEILPLPGNLPARPQASERSDVKYLFDAVRRQRAFIVKVACVCFVALCCALLLVVPVYESTARVVIDPPGSEAFSLQAVGQGLSEPDYIETQAHVLKSEGLAIGVVRQLKLAEDPVVMKKGLVAKLMERSHLNQILASLRHKVRHSEVSDDTHLTTAEVIALDYLTGHLAVSPVKNSRVIEVSFKSPSAELSSEVPNALVSLYVTENYATRYEAVMKSSEWLSRQLDDIRAKALASQEALANYQKEYGIAEVDDKQNTVSEREGELIRQYTQAQADRIQMESYLMRVRHGDAASVPQFRTNPVTQQITEKLVDLKGQLSQAEVSYGQNHPVVTRLQNEIAELQHQLQAQEQAIINEIQAGFAAASNRENKLQDQVKSTTLQMSQMSRYGILRREAQANQDLYDALYARVKEAGISAASKSSNITVVDKARVLDSPTWPRLTLMLPIALLVSWVGALSAGLARDGMDGSVRSAEDVRFANGDRNLVLVPEFSTPATSGLRRAVRRYRFPLTNPRKNDATRLDKFMLDRPGSLEAESVRSLLSTLVLAPRQEPIKVMLVTSPSPRDGKTTLAYNLALALAAKGSVCFVDADLRKSPRPSESGSDELLGVNDYCNGSACLEEIACSSEDQPNLSIIHAGNARRSPVHVLMSTPFQLLIGHLRAKYEFVVIDAPPLLPFADARFLTVLADGVILAARSAVTDRRLLDAAVDVVDRLGVPIIAVALNGVSAKQFPYRNYYAGVTAK